uniref:Immunoglobulin V-set domain-containing protein n=1 Tax=Amphiprion percula TaxID=161767 RepID=A0A3P8U233_AMPPE
MKALQRLTAGNSIEQPELLIGAEELKERRGRSLFYIRRKLRMNVQRLLLFYFLSDEAESDRYFIRFVQDPNKRSFTVKTTIFQLKLSDSGLYSCGLGESLTSASFLKFNILSSGSPPFSPPPETFNQFSGKFISVYSPSASFSVKKHKSTVEDSPERQVLHSVKN